MKSRSGFKNAYVFIMLFAFFFMIPSLILFNDFKNGFVYKDLVKNGTETYATVVTNSARSTSEINGVKYYSIEYTFTDSNNETHTGRTSEAYTYSEIVVLKKNGTILIKYNPKTFQSIQATYKMGSSPTTTIFLVFTGVDIIIWGVAIFLVVKEIKNRKILKNGKVYIATYVSSGSNVKVNGMPMFHIKYFWENENGEMFEEKSGHDYTYMEAMAFETAKTFKVKAANGKSVIYSTPAELVKLNTKNEKTKLKQEENIKCEYCGSLYSSKKTQCPSCGATRKL